MTMSVPPLVVVLLCIIGAGALVTAFAAFGKSMFSKEQTETSFNQRSAEQDDYLSRVREMNRMAIWGQARSLKREERRQREREASDIEVQSAVLSGRSYSNVGHGGGGPAEYPQHSVASHQGQQSYGNHAPATYYEQEYAGHEYANYGYEEQQHYQQQQPQQQYQRTYAGGYENHHMTTHPKAGPAETWNEVPR